MLKQNFSLLASCYRKLGVSTEEAIQPDGNMICHHSQKEPLIMNGTANSH